MLFSNVNTRIFIKIFTLIIQNIFFSMINRENISKKICNKQGFKWNKKLPVSGMSVVTLKQK